MTTGPMTGGVRGLVAILMLGSVVACSASASKSAAGTQPVSAAAEAPGAASGQSGYQDITVEGLRAMLKSGDVTLVNVHTPHGEDIPGTDLSIPYDRIRDHVAELPEDKDAEIVLYCRSGHMSVKAAADLVAMGYTRVYSLTGGLKAWRAAAH